METSDDVVRGADVDAVPPPDDELSVLRAALESAGDLPLDDRLALLKRTEATIAEALEGLDGL